jgi:chromosome segregation ATPase
MKRKSFFYAFIAVFCLFSCENKTGKSNVTEDSLSVRTELQQQEIDEMTSVIDQVTACLDSIQIQEKMLFTATEGQTDKQKMLAQLSSFKDLLARKQAEINKLMEENKEISSSSNKTIKNLQKMIDFLNVQLAEKDKRISNLEKQINQGKAQLNNLAFDYAILEDEKSYLEEQNNAQELQINTAYYIVASKSDLKKAGLLKSNLFKKKVVNENIDESLFTKIDVRKTTSIQINSKSPKILTNNPASSYTLIKNDDKTSTLTITDAKKFWNVSKYLIIQE